MLPDQPDENFHNIFPKLKCHHSLTVFASGEVLLQILKVFEVKNHLSHCAVIVYSISDIFISDISPYLASLV